MRRFASVALGVVLAACSSNPPASTDNGAIGPEQALGTPCNPALAQPCDEVTDACSVAVCDPTALRCVRVAVEAGPLCGNGLPPDDGGLAADATIDDAGESGDATGALDASDASDAATDAPSDVSISDSSVDAAEDGSPLDAGSDASDAGDASSSEGGAADADGLRD